MDLITIKLGLGVLATVGLYSVLYRENKFYRFVEHMFLGLASGFMLLALVKETLKPLWWDKITGRVAEEGVGAAVQAHWAYLLLLPIGLMGYTVFSKKYNWMSRVPIGLILGFWSGQQVQVWWTRWGPAIQDSMKPIIPNNTSSFGRPAITPGMTPEAAANVANSLYPSQAISNIVFLVTVLSVMSYFFFSYDVKSKLVLRINTLGRWLLMIGLGAIFGSTVMARFALVIDRMFYIFIEFFKEALFHIR